MKLTSMGIDIAKNVFQIHFVDTQTGEIVNKPIKRAKLLEHFANRAPCRSLWGISARGAGTDEVEPSSQTDVGEVGKSFQHWPIEIGVGQR